VSLVKQLVKQCIKQSIKQLKGEVCGNASSFRYKPNTRKTHHAFLSPRFSIRDFQSDFPKDIPNSPRVPTKSEENHESKATGREKCGGISAEKSVHRTPSDANPATPAAVYIALSLREDVRRSPFDTRSITNFGSFTQRNNKNKLKKKLLN